jgi:hypothetical protein
VLTRGKDPAVRAVIAFLAEELRRLQPAFAPGP